MLWLLMGVVTSQTRVALKANAENAKISDISKRKAKSKT